MRIANQEAYEAHVYTRVGAEDLNMSEVSAIRQAIPPDTRGTTAALSGTEVLAYTRQLQSEIENGEERSIPEDMESTFPIAQELGIMTPAQSWLPTNQAGMRFLSTADEVNARDEFLVAVDGASQGDEVSLVDQYSRASPLIVLFGTETPTLTSCRYILDEVRPIFETAISEGQNVESIPGQERFTRAYEHLIELSHQIVFVDRVSDWSEIRFGS